MKKHYLLVKKLAQSFTAKAMVALVSYHRYVM